MPRIAISYRREDSGVITGRIFDRLVTHYGRDSIFRDIDDIPPGVDFRAQINGVLDESDIVLALVGPRWIGSRGGQTRLSDEADPVRVEIETALRKGVPLIPVLVLRGTMPRVSQLPETMKDFAYRNGVQVDAGQDFDVHVSRLLRAMDRILQQKTEGTPACEPQMDEAPDASTEIAPWPGLGARSATLLARSDTMGKPRPLPPSADAAAPEAVVPVPSFAPLRWRGYRAIIGLVAGVLVGVVAISGISFYLKPAQQTSARSRDVDQQLSPRASIMVLPFRNSSGDPSEDYIADAVTDDLTTDLSRLSDTLVIARATAFTYKGKAVEVREIGRKLGIRYLLEGSVGKVGTRVQANAELVDTGSAANIWADRFDTEVTSLLELYEAVTGRIAASLNLQLVRAENRRAMADRTTNPDAVDLRLRAMAHLTENETPESSLAARKSLEASLALDPNSAEAWSQLALVLVRDFMRNWNHATREDLARSEEALRKALTIDRSIAMAHMAEGYIRQVKGDHQEALDAFDRAIALNPNLAIAWAKKGHQLVFLGRAKEAPALVKKAFTISPRDPELWMFHWILGQAYFTMGDYDNAINWLQKSVELQPTLWWNRAYLISAYGLTGRLGHHEAQTALSEYREKFKNWPVPKIRDWYVKTEPNLNPGFEATLQELFNGLQMAGL